MSVIDFDDLKRHIGHNIVCVGYGLQDRDTKQRVSEFVNVSIECEDCNEVLLDFDK